METHEQGAHPHHVVDVGEGDEGDGGQVVQEHEQEVLRNTVRWSQLVPTKLCVGYLTRE